MKFTLFGWIVGIRRKPKNPEVITFTGIIPLNKKDIMGDIIMPEALEYPEGDLIVTNADFSHGSDLNWRFPIPDPED